MVCVVEEIEKSTLFGGGGGGEGREEGNVCKTLEYRILQPSVSTLLLPIVDRVSTLKYICY